MPRGARVRLELRQCFALNFRESTKDERKMDERWTKGGWCARAKARSLPRNYLEAPRGAGLATVIALSERRSCRSESRRYESRSTRTGFREYIPEQRRVRTYHRTAVDIAYCRHRKRCNELERKGETLARAIACHDFGMLLPSLLGYVPRNFERRVHRYPTERSSGSTKDPSNGHLTRSQGRHRHASKRRLFFARKFFRAFRVVVSWPICASQQVKTRSSKGTRNCDRKAIRCVQQRRTGNRS